MQTERRTVQRKAYYHLLEMNERWKFHRLRFNTAALTVSLLLLLFLQNLSLSCSLNSEGLALLRFRERVLRDPYDALSNWDDSGRDINPCSWFGVECSEGKVVILNLKDLCLGGTVAPELGNLSELKSIILRNNSFFGTIPKEIGELKELKVLDLGYNNFSGPFPSDFGNNLSLTTLLLDNNQYLGSISQEIHELEIVSEFKVDENQLTDTHVRASSNNGLFLWNKIQQIDIAFRRQLQQVANGFKVREKGSEPSSSSIASSPASLIPPSLSPSKSPLLSPSLPFPHPPSPLESPLSSSSVSPPLAEPPVQANMASVSSPPQLDRTPTPAPVSTPSQIDKTYHKPNHYTVFVLAGIIGGSLLILISAFGIIFYRTSKVVTVKPWVTGLSGQLQKAFVTGVPKLKRPELEAACEDFSNIIGSFSDGTVYKGTLSSGVEIAVTSTSFKSRAHWSKNLESQFRKKIDTLSKVNHKNFVNLIGYCEEDEPFTRMMVFEYAPNGTLFEHLHILEAEHLDWAMRLRIAMGMAYCLEHIHQLTPPIAHRSLHSSSIYLTEDYAAKISDFSFWNDMTAAKFGSAATELLDTSAADLESNVYSFGVILFEMITGRIPYSMENGFLEEWALDYLKGEKPLKDMVDPTLESFQAHEIEGLLEVIKNCLHPDPKQRPPMRDIVAKLKEITAMGPDGATPKLSPLWWAELEILSTEVS